jgi:3-isopropylmalate dehydrogenase
MKLLVLPGDGIGPEIVDAAVNVLRAADARFGLGLHFDYEDVGFASLEKHGTTLRDETLQKARGYDGIILGTQSHADYPKPEKGGHNISAAFRVKLDLYANVRPARTRPFLPSNMKAGKTMDLVIVREATEGFYPDRNMAQGWGEMMPSPDMALSVRKITRHCSDRIARRAFELAMKRRKKVTAIQKANSFHMTDGLFLECVRNAAKDFPEVQLDDLLVDASTAHLVRNPERFDVMVAENFYGDILSDLASELSGSLGLAGSMMAGDQLCCAQAQHGSAPDIQGQDKANPVSMILSVSMLLGWLAERRSNGALARAAKAIDAPSTRRSRTPRAAPPTSVARSAARPSASWSLAPFENRSEERFNEDRTQAGPSRRAAGRSRRGTFSYGCVCAGRCQGLPEQAHRARRSLCGRGQLRHTRARQVAEKMARYLGKPVVVDNKPGGNGNTDFIARSAPDGHTTIGIGNFAPLAVNTALYDKLPYNPKIDLVPVALLEKGPVVLVVSAEKSPHTGLKELVAAAKASPGKMSYAKKGREA